PAQGEPELDAVAGRSEVAAGELLDLADPVAERVAVAVQAPGGGLALPVALDGGLERAHELAAVVALTVLDRAEQRLAEEPQGVGVLQREQELEGAEVAVRRDRCRGLRAGVTVAGGAVPGRRAELARLERAARLVVRLARPACADRPPGARGRTRPERLARALDDALAQLEELVVEEAGEQRADEAATARDEPADRLRAERLGERCLARLAGRALARSEHERADLPAEPERLEPADELLALEVAGDDGGEDVARQAALGRVGDAAAEQLEGDDRHGLVEDEAVDLGQAA